MSARPGTDELAGELAKTAAAGHERKLQFASYRASRLALLSKEVEGVPAVPLESSVRSGAACSGVNRRRRASAIGARVWSSRSYRERGREDAEGK